jgi:hypothetical protein
MELSHTATVAKLLHELLMDVTPCVLLGVAFIAAIIYRRWG